MLRKLVYSAVIFVIFLVVAELAARLVESELSSNRPAPDRPGWQAEFFGSLFDWHEPDPDLLWRFKANLDNPLITTTSQHYIGREVAADKPPGTYRILLLGDSSPVGLGLQSHKQTFAEILRLLLSAEMAATREVEVINAAVSGYSSEQIRAYLELKGWSYDPDLIVVYCGNNDASISGQYSDQELLELGKARSLRRFLAHTALYRLARSTLASSKNAGDANTPLKVRVSAERYHENLARVADRCVQRHCPLILIKPPVPLLWPAGLQFKPFTHVTGEDGKAILPEPMAAVLGRQLKYCLSRDLFAQLYGRGDVFTKSVYASAWADTLPPVEAVSYWNREVIRNPSDPVVHNNLGVSVWQTGEYRSADYAFRNARGLFASQHPGDQPPNITAAGSPFLYNIGINLLSSGGDWREQLAVTVSPAHIYLDSALQADFFSLRVKREYWEALDRLGARPGVTVVDLPGLFARNGGEGLFIDHCHPTAEGHVLIARELQRIISGLTR